MAGKNLPVGIDRGADGLGDAEHDAAGQRAPEDAEPADDHRLEGEDQPRRADGGIEIGADAEKRRAATAATASAMPMATAKMRVLSMPINCAVIGSSEMARKARPSAVR